MDVLLNTCDPFCKKNYLRISTGQRMMKPAVLILSLFIFSFQKSYSQSCEVLVEALKGHYEGGCKKNKAEGQGTAKGEDSYTGQFKAGLPDGFGKYVWKNGDWYEGHWKKGVREGKGIMKLTAPGTKDSVLDGYWKKDKYIGKYEQPYKVHHKTADIVQINVKFEKSNIREIVMSLESTRGGAMAISRQMPKPTITNIDVINGLYINQMDQRNMPKTNTTTFRGVVYPFRARINIGSELMDLEFFEEGKYTVEIRINQ
jgi:hypothetical protein